ncbi:50S ribosomal protein L30e-like protein [Catenaria anguillulae PL171]|uniref:50S ribosomal protein L30e-like protein n=1 Tax=Catenaria anguillulae PL171 TaxID=765915 RepID=A0A1Y2I2Z8_9FUNG|nr:50S ribosomal protein L30e-like protein [Catenaria anguillulae PL171]
MTSRDNDAAAQVADLRHLISTLEPAHAISTMSSLISLAIPPAIPLTHVTNLLADEHRAASRIKSAPNRHAITSAIALTQAKLAQFAQVPVNGVYVYCGTVHGRPDQEQQVVDVAYKPVVPVKQFMYMCDKAFSVDVLVEALEEMADADFAHELKMERQQKMLARFFDEHLSGSGKCCFGIRETLKALDLGAVETLILSEHLEIQRYVLKNPAAGPSDKHLIKHLTPAQAQEQEHFAQDGQKLEIIDQQPLLAWFTANVADFGAKLKLVTGQLQEGQRFVSEYGGIGGLLRYRLDLGQ